MLNNIFLNIYRNVRFFLVFSLLLMAVACGSSPRQQVEEVLVKREQALAAKNIRDYMALVSRDYYDEGKTYKDILEKAEKNFSTFSKIELTTSKRGIYIEEDQAVAVQEFVLSFWIQSKRKSVKNKERLVLKKEKDNWKIIKGL